jgi:hypothetical protein
LSPRSIRSPTAAPSPGALERHLRRQRRYRHGAKALELGGEVVTGPFDAPWAKLAVINDPQGATFIASQFVPENKDLKA